jgi:hypothetical protein
VGTEEEVATAAADLATAAAAKEEANEQGTFELPKALQISSVGGDESEEGPSMMTMGLRVGFCAVASVISIAMLSFGVIVPRRYTHTMTLLKDAKTIRIGTYQIVGRRDFDVPISALTFGFKFDKEAAKKTSTYSVLCSFLDGSLQLSRAVEILTLLGVEVQPYV